MPRPTKDAKHQVLTSVMEAMLQSDEQISARAVVARHPSLASASAITRHPERLALLREYSARQDSMRDWARRTQKRSKQHLAIAIAKKDERIKRLELDVTALVESHLHLISLVAEMGGIRRLRDFYQHQRLLRTRLALNRALPAELVDE